MKQDKTSRGLNGLFEKFIVEKTYLENRSPRTISWYRQTFKAYKKIVGTSQILNKEKLNQFIIELRQRGVSVGGCNAYIKGMNSFLVWLYQNGHLGEPLRMKVLKKEKKVMRAFTDEELYRLVSFWPTTFTEYRLHTLICTLIDTGCRIDELLTLTRDKVNLDSMLLVVVGKGAKERVIPISVELKEGLLVLLQQHSFPLVFPSSNGTKWNYANALRDLGLLCKRSGVVPSGFHTFRRTFARNYLKKWGNLIFLKTALGHSRLETTEKYVEVDIDDLKETHQRTSILNRLSKSSQVNDILTRGENGEQPE